MASRRQQTKDDKRGSAASRRARKTYLLSAFGDGTSVACVHCGVSLTFATLQADRIIPGGSYRRDNVQPSCARDNIARSDNAAWISPLAAAAVAVNDAMSSALVSA